MTVSFTARPVAIYKPFSDATQKSLTVYELEARDIKFLSQFKKELKNNTYLKEEKKVYHTIALESLESIIKSLKINRQMKVSDKSVAYVAVNDKKITSLIQGNLPKINFEQNKIVYSNRNVAKETELDWLSSIPSRNGEQTPKSSAPAVVAELLNYCFRLPDKFKSMYCRSELPKNCEKTASFYEKIGFKAVGGAQKMETSDRPIDLNHFVNVDGFEYSNDETLPYSITRNAAKEAVKNIAKRFGREEIKDGKSVDLKDFVTID